MTRLLLTGGYAPWTLAALFVLMSVTILAVYRRQALAAPWHIVLPALRIAATALLLCALLRPVLARYQTIANRGRIGLILDNSRSMSVRDDYRKHELIDIGWHMDLYPPHLRTTVFRDTADRMDAVAASLRQRGRTAAEVRQRLASYDPAAPQAARRLARAVADVGRRADAIRLEVERLVTDTAYLQGDVAAMPAADVPVHGLLLRRYDGIRGDDVRFLESAATFPQAPDVSAYVEDFESPRDVGERYGTTLTGYLLPPRSGDYRFLMSSDDRAVLRISEGEDPGRTRDILRTGVTAWDRPGARSGIVRLIAQKRYFVQALLKENGGRDHLRVGWERPDGKIEFPIATAHLAPVRAGSETNDFAVGYAAWTRGMQRSAEALGRESARLDAIGGTGAGTHARQVVERAAEQIAGLVRDWPRLQNELAALQAAADTRLADAGAAEVDAAMEHLRAGTRWALLQDVLHKTADPLLAALATKGEVDVFLLDAETVAPIDRTALANRAPDLASTRLGSAVAGVMQHYEDRPVAGLVVLTDGNNNAGRALGEARELAAARGVPLLVAGVGAPRPPHDLAIESVIAPDASFKGDALTVRSVLHRPGFEHRALTLRVSSDGEIRREVLVAPGAERRVTVEIAFVEEEDGERDYVVEVDALEGEALTVNNARAFTVNVFEDRIRTLLVDEFPRWESRYLRMMLSRDRRVDLRTVFVASLTDGVLTTGPETWPRTRDELFGFQLIVLGDVNPAHFSRQQLQDLHDFVTERGGTLVAMAGEHYMPREYETTPLIDVLPAGLLRPRMGGRGAAGMPAAGGSISRPLVLTDEGKHDTLVQIGLTPETSARLWARLPGVNWVRDDVDAPPVADALVRVAGEALPVMAKAYAGAGKCLFIGADSFWRWRDRAGRTYHHRLWGQVVLWGALDRTTGSDKYVKMMSDRLHYAPGETVLVHTRLLNDEGVPIERAQASLVVQDERGETVHRAALIEIPGSGGGYQAAIAGLPRGRFSITPDVFELLDRELDARINVEVGDAAAGEYAHLALNEGPLKRWADAYRPYYDLRPLLERIKPVTAIEERREDYLLWANPWVLLLAAGLLGAEWHYRRRCRLA